MKRKLVKGGVHFSCLQEEPKAIYPSILENSREWRITKFMALFARVTCVTLLPNPREEGAPKFNMKVLGSVCSGEGKLRDLVSEIH